MALIVQILSAASIGQRYFVNLGNGQAKPGQPILLWGWSDISWNDSWEMTPEGMIACPVNPDLVIGADSNGDVWINPRGQAGFSQLWRLEPTADPTVFTILNQTSGQYLTVPGSSIGGAPQLTTAALGSGVPQGQGWFIEPAQLKPAAQQFYIRTRETANPTIGSGTPWVMTASGSSATDIVVLDPWQPFAPSQLWTLNGDGTISSGYGSSLVLTTTGVSDSNITIDTPGAPNTIQTWIVGDQGNDKYKDLIYVQTSSGGTLNLNLRHGSLSSGENILAYYEQPYADNDFWELIPAQPIPPGTWFSLRVNETAEGSPYVLTAAGGTPDAVVTIDPLQPGAANQLWLMQANGVIVSALNPKLALTANSSSDTQVALHTAQSGSPDRLQQWYVQGDGNVVVDYGGGTGLQYLNVQSGGPAAPGTAVITYGFQSGGSNSTWSVLPYQPDPSGQWFTIRSATVAPGSGTPYLLTAWPHGQVLAMPPQDRTIAAGGLPGINQLWRMTMQGAIVSAVNPNLALTGNGGSDVSLAPWNGGLDQQWAWGASATLKSTIGKHSEDILCGVLQNLGGSSEVLFAGTADAFHQPVTLQSEKGYAAAGSLQSHPGAFWYVVPFLPAFDQWTTIRSLAGDGLFLNLPAKPKTSVQATVGPQNGSLSTWQFAWPGYIVSATSPEIVLSLSVDGISVVAYPRQPGPQPFQLWAATPDGALVNWKNGQAMTASETASVWTVTTSALSGSPDNSQRWEFSPGTALQAALAQPSVPYPEAATTAETTAYDYVNQSLGLSQGGLRPQYGNLAAPLASYQSRLNALLALPPPAGVSNSDLSAVVSQLNEELTAVIAVQTLFQQVTTLYLELSQAQAMALTEIVTAAELPNGMQTMVRPKPKKKGKWGWVSDVVEGLVYTGLNVAGATMGDPNVGKQLISITNGLPCLANLFETSFNVCASEWSYGTSKKGARASAARAQKLQTLLKNMYKYELSVLQMQQTLLTVFQESGTALGEMETLILADWGKLQAVYRMIRTPGGISSLYWPSTMTSMLAGQMLPGYITGVLQVLMPANSGFTIDAALHGSQPEPTGLTSDNTEFVEDNDDGTQNYYSTKANQEVMAMVFANGTDPADFFRGLNGWALPITYQIAPPNSQQYPATADIVVSMQNFTNQPLQLVINCTGLLSKDDGGLLIDIPTTRKVTIPAYGATDFAGATYIYTDLSGDNTTLALGGTFTVTDSNSRSVVSGTISYSIHKSAAEYSWTISSSPPYRGSIEQVPVNPSSMYLLNIGIYYMGG